MNLDHDGFNCGIARIIAVIETGRIEAVAKVPQVGQQTDRTIGSLTDIFIDEFCDSLSERNLWVTKVIPAAKAGQIEAFVSPQGVDVKKRRQLVEIEKHEEQAILKHIRLWPEPAVSDGPLVDTTMHDSFHG